MLSTEIHQKNQLSKNENLKSYALYFESYI